MQEERKSGKGRRKQTDGGSEIERSGEVGAREYSRRNTRVMWISITCARSFLGDVESALFPLTME